MERIRCKSRSLLKLRKLSKFLKVLMVLKVLKVIKSLMWNEVMRFQRFMGS